MVHEYHLVVGLLGDRVGEGVGDLDLEEPDRDQSEGIRLVDPVLTDHVLQGEVHDHGAEGVGVSHLWHGESWRYFSEINQN